MVLKIFFKQNLSSGQKNIKVSLVIDYASTDDVTGVIINFMEEGRMLEIACCGVASGVGCQKPLRLVVDHQNSA